MKRLGSVEKLGMKVFVQELCEFQNKYSIPTNETIPYLYKSFETYEPKRPRSSATSIEVYDLFMMGEMKDSLWYRKEGKYNQIIFRKKIFDVITAIQNGVKVIYLHANLGNGKTLFIESLKHQLQNREFKFYTLKEVYQGITAKEIKRIVKEDGRKIVIIENYYNYLSVIRQFALHNWDNVQFVF